MLGTFRKRRAGVLLYALLAALVVGLAGFGIGAGRTISSDKVARVGDVSVTSQDFVRAMQQELRALQQQTGRTLSMAEARQYGVDRMVLSRLVNDAAVDGEAARLGLSTGDETVRKQVLDTPAFKGSDGTFSREAYTASLERAGLRPPEFERLLRQEATRDLLARSVQSAAGMPETAATTVLGFLGEKRAFDWLALDATLLPEPIPAPTDADLQAEHDAHAADRYTRPETREVAYASITPDALAAGIEIPDDELRAAYDADPTRYQTPEKRAIDRIGFATDAEAADAKAKIDAGTTDFDKVAAERGMAPADIDQGTVAADALPATARDAVFGLAEPGIVGPVETPLGPALYRVNAIMAGHTTSFEDARADLARSRARDQAQKQILDETARIQDLIAGGATLEEIASETVMELGSVALNSETTGGIADDAAFRQTALAAPTGEETDLIELAGGGIASLRVDRIDPPAVIPLAEVRDRVAADWTANRTADALEKLATDMIAEVKAGATTFAGIAQRLDRPIRAAGPINRGETADGAPAALVADVFAAEKGTPVARRDGDRVILADVTAITPFDPASGDNRQILDSLAAQYRDQARGDVFALYTAALREAAGVTVNQPLLESTLERFP